MGGRGFRTSVSPGLHVADSAATSVANRSVIGARLPEDQPPGRPVSRLAAGRYNDWGDEVGGSNPLAPTRRGNALVTPVATSVATSPAISLRSRRSRASSSRSARSPFVTRRHPQARLAYPPPGELEIPELIQHKAPEPVERPLRLVRHACARLREPQVPVQPVIVQWLRRPIGAPEHPRGAGVALLVAFEERRARHLGHRRHAFGPRLVPDRAPRHLPGARNQHPPIGGQEDVTLPATLSVG